MAQEQLVQLQEEEMVVVMEMEEEWTPSDGESVEVNLSLSTVTMDCQSVYQPHLSVWDCQSVMVLKTQKPCGLAHKRMVKMVEVLDVQMPVQWCHSVEE